MAGPGMKAPTMIYHSISTLETVPAGFIVTVCLQVLANILFQDPGRQDNSPKDTIAPTYPLFPTIQCHTLIIFVHHSPRIRHINVIDNLR